MLGSGYRDLDAPTSTKARGSGFQDQSEFGVLDLWSGLLGERESLRALLGGRLRSLDAKLDIL